MNQCKKEAGLAVGAASGRRATVDVTDVSIPVPQLVVNLPSEKLKFFCYAAWFEARREFLLWQAEQWVARREQAQ